MRLVTNLEVPTPGRSSNAGRRHKIKVTLSALWSHSLWKRVPWIIPRDDSGRLNIISPHYGSFLTYGSSWEPMLPGTSILLPRDTKHEKLLLL